MGVKGAWKFLDNHDITGTPVRRPIDVLDWREPQNKIHVDVVDAFFKLSKKFFLDCDVNDQQSMVDASNNFLDCIGDIVPQDRCILYLNGNPTLERDLAYSNKMVYQLKRQQKLDQELLEYEARPNGALLAKIETRFRNSFRFAADMKQVLY